MADVSQIKLPDNTIVNIKDATARNLNLSSTYDDETHTVTLTAGFLGDADNTEY